MFVKNFKISEAIRYKHKTLSKIEIDGINIKLGPIRNKKIYMEKIQEDTDYDLLMRIQSINGNEDFNLEQLEQLFDELDLDVIENIIKIYDDHKFTIDNINTVKCKCGHEQTYEFDEIPGFLPESWFGE